MSTTDAVVVVLAVVATLGLLAVFVVWRRHPEAASGHAATSGGWDDRGESFGLHGDVSDRPAGPGAEADGVAGRGQPTPGPSAESLPTRRADP
ncbi:MAG: hypothetical protein KDB40_21175 [Acidimicrobiales bacterium]|nr:hypothetical protein [Acidimicrobiales bacterium]